MAADGERTRQRGDDGGLPLTALTSQQERSDFYLLPVTQIAWFSRRTCPSLVV
jgi:hypothetical protein